MPICLSCNINKKSEEFSPDLRRKTHHHPYCKFCKAQKMRSKRHIRKDHRILVLNRPEKPCSKCHVIKSKSLFWKNTKHIDGLDSTCKQCRKTTKKYNLKYKINAEEIKLKLINLIGGSCAHCGLVPSDEWPVNCFDFHHTNVDNKNFNISKVMLSTREDDIKLIKLEVLKCIPLCANCHRKVHSYRYSVIS